jgi:hypothetical protein
MIDVNVGDYKQKQKKLQKKPVYNKNCKTSIATINKVISRYIEFEKLETIEHEQLPLTNLIKVP